MDDDDDDESNVVPTSAVTFVETEHGRLRRQQRGIDKKDLQAAIKYGKKQRSFRFPDKRTQYTHNGIVYIVENETGKEVTSFTEPLKLQNVPVSDKMRKEHDGAIIRIQSNMNAWLSNTVLVVDTSGSMREADVWGVRSRLHSAWVAIALDFLAHRLEMGAAGPMDVLSIVTLGEKPEVVVREQPSSWVLYNRLLSIYRKNSFPARGHGPYLPSIDTAEQLLKRNRNASCALALGLLSDGRPSDGRTGGSKGSTREQWNRVLVERIGSLSKQFGRRLSFMAIGIGKVDDFELLKEMADASSDFGANALFTLPSMSSASIGGAFTSLAKSLTTTQIEMTDVRSLKQLRVRDRPRESKKKAAEVISKVSEKEFWIYSRDDVKRTVYHETMEGSERKGAFQPASLQHPDAHFVAFGKEPFGEGAERFAYRFFELAADGETILGRPLVAKENRLIVEEREDDEKARKKFARTFCKTQQLARRLAQEFNQKLDEMQRVDKATPRVKFLDCSIYETDDKKLGKLSVLVEERLDQGKWYKFNLNNGFVEGMKTAPRFNTERIRGAFTKLATEDLGIIEEGSDEEDEDSENADDKERSFRRVRPVVFTPSQVAQAFSHFSYWATGRKRLVCDLQGVYDSEKNVLIFSDPVIHYHNPGDQGRRQVHGRTDRGRKGVAMFFDTHQCTDLCKLVTKGFKDLKRRRSEPDEPDSDDISNKRQRCS